LQVEYPTCHRTRRQQSARQNRRSAPCRCGLLGGELRVQLSQLHAHHHAPLRVWRVEPSLTFQIVLGMSGRREVAAHPLFTPQRFCSHLVRRPTRNVVPPVLQACNACMPAISLLSSMNSVMIVTSGVPLERAFVLASLHIPEPAGEGERLPLLADVDSRTLTG